MWIKEYSNEQYAGVRGQSVRFEPGINVVLGDNEAGKSTMITGIYDTLTRSHRIDGRRDKEFIAGRFPSGGANSIDGSVRLCAGGHDVVVKKEWDKSGADSRTVLITDGVKTTGTAAEEQLRRLLSFSGAIYDNIIFGRQNNEDEICRWLFSFMDDSPAKKTDDAVAEARERISGAISAAGGISEDRFAERLNTLIDALSGKWDFTADRPSNGRGISNPWKNGAGEIVRAYYALEEKRAALNAAELALDAFYKNGQALEEKKALRESCRQQQKALSEKKADAVRGDSLRRELARMEQDCSELNQAAGNWPLLLEEQRVLERLSLELAEKRRREARAQAEAGLAKAEELSAGIAALADAMAGMENISMHCKECAKLSADARASRGILGSGKLHARIRMLDGRTGVLRSASGETLDLSGTMDADLDGYVEITIPGVAELVVAPQNVDVHALHQQIEEADRRIAAILSQYCAHELTDLERMADQYLENSRRMDALRRELDQIPVDEYRAAVQISVDPALDVREDLDGVIAARLRSSGFGSLDGRIGAIRQAVASYCEKYASPQALCEKLAALTKSCEETRRQLALLPAGIPSAVALDEQDRRLESQITRLNREIEDLSKSLGGCDDIDLELLERETEECRLLWEQKKALCQNYCTIRRDFQALQDSSGGKYEAFFDLFNHHLAIVTDGRVTVGADRQFASGGNSGLRGDLLSRGTRQTVLLAFRLALLDYYYGDGGGVVVLDDVLLDMDPVRRANAARLIAGFAQRHQVIFTTCDPAVADLLGGHLIRIG